MMIRYCKRWPSARTSTALESENPREEVADEDRANGLLDVGQGWVIYVGRMSRDRSARKCDERKGQIGWLFRAT